MKQEVVEAAAAASAVTVSKGITYGGSTVAIVSSFAANQFFAIAGLVVAVVGLVVNVYFQRKRDQREERHLRMQEEALMKKRGKP